MASLLEIFNGPFEAKPTAKASLPNTADRLLVSDNFGSRLLEYLDLDIDKGPWLAGGAVRKFYLGQKIDYSDWDFWFSSPEQFDHARNLVVALGCSEVYSTDNAVSYKYYEGTDTHNIQLIRRRFFNSAEEIIDGFDFTVCQLVTDGRRIKVGPETILDIKSKTLRLAQKSLPSHIVPRMVKYMVYGYRPATELLEMIEEAGAQIDWTKPQLEYDAI
jgi:hypothetical protein